MAKQAAPAFPLFGDLSEKKMRSRGEKLDALQDPNGFKHYDLLAKHTDRPEGDVGRVRSIVYASKGYALGGPLWLQDGDAGEDDSFLFQFDEGLCPINLGDCGVMYVFDHGVSWQCH